MAKVTQKAGTAVAKAGGVAMSSQMPEYMREYAGQGTENLSRDDLEIPRLKLIQGISPELEAYSALRAGDFFHTAMELPIKPPFKAVPIYVDRRYILWNPRASGGGILARADDGEHWTPADAKFDVKLDPKDGGARVTWKTARTIRQSGLDQWGSMDPSNPNSPPAATLMYSYVLAFPEHPDWLSAVFSFQRSSVKVGRQLNTKLKVGTAPIFGRVIEFGTGVGKNNVGQEFKVPTVSAAGFLTDTALFHQYREANEGFTRAGLQIKDLESAQDEDPGDNEGDEEEAPKGKGAKNRRF